MREQGLVSRQRTKHRYKQADKPHRIHDNVLNREFDPTAPNQVWTGMLPTFALSRDFAT